MERSELGRVTLGVLLIGALIIGSMWILRPFLGALVWATMVVVATWPVLLKLERAFGGRRAPAVAVMTTILLAVLIVPLGTAISALVSNLGDAGHLVDRLRTLQIPAAPEWLAGVPFVGERAAAMWAEQAQLSGDELVAQLEPYTREIARWLADRAGGVAGVFVQFLLIVVLSAVLYAGGEAWGGWMRRFGRRLAGERGDRMTLLAAGAIRGVAMGVVVTALLQSVLGGIGLAIAGVPFAGVLTAVMLMLCIAQLGPIPVLLIATIWTFSQLGTGWGTFMAIWSVVVGLMDNFIRPVLIRRGADLPLLLIIAGVIGGLVAFGVIGIFIGPVVLAIAFTLMDEWVGEAPAADERAPTSAPGGPARAPSAVAAGAAATPAPVALADSSG